MFIFLIIIFGLPSFLLVIDFIKFIITGKHIYNQIVLRVLEFASMIALPISYFWLLDENINDCCSDSATFSPKHKLSIYVYIIISELFYFYSSFRTRIYSPIVEVLTNSMLLIGFVLNILIAIQIGMPILLFGNIAIGILFIYQLFNNHKLFLKDNENSHSELMNNGEKIAWKLLKLNLIIKIPILLILSLPIITIISSFLILFGQKPDAMIKAFTDTYKHGFSQLDYLCDNVNCGGHYLCSVAANGHLEVVKPIRYGERHNCKIICNRQLLISNAFEELIEQKSPIIHRIIRRNYNKIGNFIHRYYGIFNNKIFSDIIYVFMKPLEIFFILVLYTFDNNPENRIAQQYLSKKDREKIDNTIANGLNRHNAQGLENIEESN